MTINQEDLGKSYLTVEEAAARRGCSASTIWRRIRQGDLTPERYFGRVVVRVSDVDAMDGPQGGGRWQRRQNQ